MRCCCEGLCGGHKTGLGVFVETKFADDLAHLLPPEIAISAADKLRHVLNKRSRLFLADHSLDCGVRDGLRQGAFLHAKQAL